MADPPLDAEARRLARAKAHVRVVRAGDSEAEADADANYWLQIPVNERAKVVWQLSVESFALAKAGRANDEPRLSRSVARVLGR